VQFTRALAVSISLLGPFASGGASAAGASATVLSASFTTDGVNTVLDPVNRILSGPGSTYDKTLKMGVYHKELNLSADGAIRPTLTVNAAGGSSHVKGAFGVDTISAEGQAAVGGLRVLLAAHVLPDVVQPAPYLQIMATRVQEAANYNFVAPSFTTVSGTSQFNALTITGSLVGGKTLKVTGAEKPNTVLYQSATVTITLNKKIETALISCTPKCVVTPYSVSTAGIDVALNRAKLSGHTVSGNITIAGGSAGQGL
jgi:hypothetical protein